MPELDAHRRFQEKRETYQQRKATDWNKVVFRNAMTNYGKFQKGQPKMGQWGPDRKLRPRPEQGAWESGYAEYLRGNRPKYQETYLTDTVRDPNDTTGIDYWRKNDYISQFAGGQVGKWNGTQITGPSGTKLPKGALGFDFNGDIYWGTGADAFGAKFSYRLNGDPNIQAPDHILEMKEAQDSVLGLEGNVRGVDLGKSLNNAVDWFSSQEEGENIISKAVARSLRLTGAVLGYTMDWANEPAIQFEMFQGGLQGVGELGEQVKTDLSPSGTAVAPTLQDVTKADAGKLSSSLAHGLSAGTGFIVSPKDFEGTKFPGYVENFFNAGLEMFNSANVGIEFVRGNVEWDDIMDNYELGAAAGRAHYSQVLDAGVREEMKRRIAGGEDPVLVSQELANPWAEMAGQIILDPVDWAAAPIGGAIKAYKAQKIAQRSIGVSDDIMDAVRTMQKAHGNVAVAMALDDVVQAVSKVMGQNADVAEHMLKMRGDIGIFARTASGKQFRVAQDTGEVMGRIIAATAGNPDDTAQALAAMWKIADTEDKAKIAEGMADLINLMPSMKPILSEQGLEAAYVMRQLFDKADDPMRMIKKAGGDVEKLADLMAKRMDRKLKHMFPTVDEIVKAKIANGERVNSVMKAALRVHKIADPKMQWMRTAFSKVYMQWSPGFAFRNFAANTVQQVVDQGPLSVARGVGLRGWWFGSKVDDDTRKMLHGVLPKGAQDAFGGTAVAGEGTKAGGFLRASEWAEQRGASMVVNHKVREVMTNALQEGKAIPSVKDFVKAGWSEDNARTYISFVQDEWGDTAKATKRYLDALGQDGFIDVFKEGTFLTHAQKKTLRDYDIYEDFTEVLRKAESKEEAIGMWQDAIDRIDEFAKRVVDDAPVMDEAGAVTEDFAEAIAGVHDAMGDKAGKRILSVMNWHGEANNQAARAMEDAMSQLLQQTGERFAEMWNTPIGDGRLLRNLVSEPGRLAGKAKEMVDNLQTTTWNASQFLKDPNKVTHAQLRKVWDKFDDLGPYIFDELDAPVAARKMKDVLWVNYYEKSSSAYRVARQEAVNAMNTVVQAIKLENISDRRLYKKAQYFADVASEWDQVARTEIWQHKVMWQQTGKDWNGVTNTMLKAFGLDNANRGTAANKRYMANILNLYGPAKKEASVPVMITQKMRKELTDLGLSPEDIGKLTPDQAWEKLGGMPTGWTAEDIDTGKVTWEMMRDALASRMSFKTGLKGDWDYVEAVQKVDANEIKNTLESAGIEYRLVANADEPNLYRMQVKADSGRFINVTKDWVAGADEVMEVGFRNVMDPSYVTVRTDKGVNLLDTHDAWQKAFKLSPTESVKKVAEAAPEAAARVDEVQEGWKLGLGIKNAAEVPENVTIPALPGVKSAVINGKRYAWIDESVKGGKDLFEHLPPIPYGGGTPSIPRVYAEQYTGLNKFMNEIGDAMGDAWGQTKRVHMDRKMNNSLQQINKVIDERVFDAQFVAQNAANEARKFSLLNYGEKRNIDTLLSYVLPYQFWYSRTYTNWIQRVVQNPSLVSKYAHYRKNLEAAHAGMPEWYRHNISSADFGILKDNPFMMNLEATLNPLWGMLGTDFNDPYKRINWWTKSIDDLGKFGPSLFTPIQWAVATKLYLDGEEEAAARWAGRIAPQTRTIKAGLNLMNIEWDTPGEGFNEIDPMVWFFSGGMDPFERNRVGRYAATLEEQRPQDKAAIEQALYSRQGDLWKEMVLGAQRLRSPGDLISFFLGVGFKPRTTTDMQIDIMDQEQRRMWANAGNNPPEWLTQEQARLQKTYPWMDTVNLSRKHGLKRDRAYAYSVLGRIPPGQKDDFFKANGLDPEWYNKFYDTRGDLSKWEETDVRRFMDFIVDAGAVLDFPDDATQQEWGVVQDFYKQVKKEQAARFGEDIDFRISEFYKLSNDKVAQDRFIQENPQVPVALAYYDRQMKNHPSAGSYYSSIEKIERYYNGFTKDLLAETYPDTDFDQLWKDYFDAQAFDSANKGAKTARAFWKEHPELGESIDLKNKANEYTNAAFVRAGKALKAPKWGDIYREAQERTMGQQMVAESVEGLQGVQRPKEWDYSWDEWTKTLESPNLANIVADWALGDRRIPSKAMDQLERQAEYLDMDVDIMLELMSESLQNRQY